ncbi:MAG: hypothetical protein JXM79_25365 [Sedimentisphaerales bacterium]|nr:hypothetical protein [Sedimentisphaerales bacterium]
MINTHVGVTSVRFLLLASMLFVHSNIHAATVSQDDWGSPRVQVLQEKAQWIIEGSRNKVEVKNSDLQMTIHTRDRTWSMIPSFSGDLIVEKSGKRFPLRLADATKKNMTPYHTGFKSGLKISLAGFTQKDEELDVQIDLYACLEGRDEELVCELIATEKNTTVLECFWPQALANDCFDVTIVPLCRGCFCRRIGQRKSGSTIPCATGADCTCPGGVIRRIRPPCSF